MVPGVKEDTLIRNWDETSLTWTIFFLKLKSTQRLWVLYACVWMKISLEDGDKTMPENLELVLGHVSCQSQSTSKSQCRT